MLFNVSYLLDERQADGAGDGDEGDDGEQVHAYGPPTPRTVQMMAPAATAMMAA